MLNQLQLLRSAISKKDLKPMYTSVHSYANRMQGTNGHLTIDSVSTYINKFNFDFTTNYDKFLKAIKSCKETPILRLTKAGFLIVENKTLKIRLPLEDHAAYPKSILPNNLVWIKVNNNFIQLLKRLQPFMGKPSLRLWINSIHFFNGFAYATTNPVMARIPAPNFPDMTLPGFLIDALIKINLTPTEFSITKDNIFIRFNEDLWIKSSLIQEPWPQVQAIMDNSHNKENDNMVAVPTDLMENIHKIIPFCNNIDFPSINFSDGSLHTIDGDTAAVVNNIHLPNSKWNAKNLLLILIEATAVDFTQWPKACPWVGDNIEGLVIGLT